MLDPIYNTTPRTDVTDRLGLIVGLAQGGLMATETSANVRSPALAFGSIFEQIGRIANDMFEGVDNLEAPSKSPAPVAQSAAPEGEAKALHNLLDEVQTEATKLEALAALGLEGLYLGGDTGGVEVSLETIVARMKALNASVDVINRPATAGGV